MQASSGDSASTGASDNPAHAVSGSDRGTSSGGVIEHEREQASATASASARARAREERASRVRRLSLRTASSPPASSHTGSSANASASTTTAGVASQAASAVAYNPADEDDDNHDHEGVQQAHTSLVGLGIGLDSHDEDAAMTTTSMEREETLPASRTTSPRTATMSNFEGLRRGSDATLRAQPPPATSLPPLPASPPLNAAAVAPFASVPSSPSFSGVGGAGETTEEGSPSTIKPARRQSLQQQRTPQQQQHRTTASGSFFQQLHHHHRLSMSAGIRERDDGDSAPPFSSNLVPFHAAQIARSRLVSDASTASAAAAFAARPTSRATLASATSTSTRLSDEQDAGAASDVSNASVTSLVSTASTGTSTSSASSSSSALSADVALAQTVDLSSLAAVIPGLDVSVAGMLPWGSSSATQQQQQARVQQAEQTQMIAGVNQDGDSVADGPLARLSMEHAARSGLGRSQSARVASGPRAFLNAILRARSPTPPSQLESGGAARSPSFLGVSPPRNSASSPRTPTTPSPSRAPHHSRARSVPSSPVSPAPPRSRTPQPPPVTSTTTISAVRAPHDNVFANTMPVPPAPRSSALSSHDGDEDQQDKAPASPTLQNLGLTVVPLTHSLSSGARDGANIPLCGAILDGRWILIGTATGLDFLPVPAAGALPPSSSSKAKDAFKPRRPISLIKRTRFRDIAVLSERSNILLAIAGRNDHVRVYALDGIRSMINRKMAEHDARSGYPIASSRRKAKDKAVPSAASAVPANEPPPPSYEEVQASTSRQPLAPRRQSSFVRQLPTNPQPGLIRRRPSAPLLEVTGDKRLRTVRSRDRLGHRSPTHATFPHRQAGSQRRHRRTGSNSASESQRPYSGATTPADAGMDGGECAEDESEGETQRQRKLPRAANTGRSRHEGEDYTADLATFFRDPFKDSDDRNWTPVHKPQLSSPNGGPFRASSPASRSSLLSPASNIGASSSSRSSPAASAEEGSLQARDPRSGERATAQDLIAFLREEQPPTGTRASLQEPRRLSPTPEESSPRARASKRWSMNNVGSIFRPGSSSPRQSPTENARTPPESRENRDNRLDSGMSPRAPATTAALAASRPVPRLSEPPLKRARSEAPLEGAPDPNIPAETHPANLQNPLEYVKLARTKGARLMKAVESKKRTYLAVLCGEKGDRVELFSGARNISLALNRTFILPQSPRRLEFQLQGDDLADIYLVFASSIFALEPTTVRVREVGVGRAERRARRERERQRRARDPAEDEQQRQAAERRADEEVQADAHARASTALEPEQAVDDQATPRPTHTVTSAVVADSASPRASVESSRAPRPPLKDSPMPYSTFQQLDAVPPVPSSVLAPSWTIPPLYTEVIRASPEPSMSSDGDVVNETPLLSPVSLLVDGSSRPSGPPGLFFVSRGRHLTGIVTSDGRSIIRKPIVWTRESDETTTLPLQPDECLDRIEVVNVDQGRTSAVVAIGRSTLRVVKVTGEPAHAPYAGPVPISVPSRHHAAEAEYCYLGKVASTSQLFFAQRHGTSTTYAMLAAL